MATETFTRLVDDIDGSKADRTVSFSWNGKGYSIDLSKKNIAVLEKALQPYINAARNAQPSRARKGHGTTAGGNSARKRDLRAIREWARVNGYAVSDRGRIGADVMSGYEAAH